jgi:hypothetical protein
MSERADRALRSNALFVRFLVLDRKSIDVESFVVKNWFGHLRPFEYEYEYEEIRPEARTISSLTPQPFVPAGANSRESARRFHLR